MASRVSEDKMRSMLEKMAADNGYKITNDIKLWIQPTPEDAAIRAGELPWSDKIAFEVFGFDQRKVYSMSEHSARQLAQELIVIFEKRDRR